MKTYGFEKLEVWNDAKKLAVRIYTLTQLFQIQKNMVYLTKCEEPSFLFHQTLLKVLQGVQVKINRIFIVSHTVV